MTDLPNFLKKLKYQKLEDFPEKDQQRMKSVLALDKLLSAIFDITVYARVFETKVDTLIEGTDEKLWSTRITLGSFVLIDDEEELIDKMIIPLKPFRIRSNSEIVEMNKLYGYIMDDFDNINKELDFPSIDESVCEGDFNNEA